jgi:hypothetical protein
LIDDLKSKIQVKRECLNPTLGAGGKKIEQDFWDQTSARGDRG